MEALNDIGQRKTQLLIVLNDNEMSISPTVGALSHYLSAIKLTHVWQHGKSAYDRAIERIPIVGPTALELSRRLRASVVSFAQPGHFFEDLGITYIGVVPGHDLRALAHTFRSALDIEGPVIVHVRTQKGKGYRPAEADRVSFHGAALPPMNVVAVGPGMGNPPSATAASNGSAGGAGNGHPASSVSAESVSDDAAPAAATVRAQADATPNYTAFFVTELLELARTDRRIVAITAGMPTGTGLSRFEAVHPDRFIDVGIAEQHAVTLATGLAMGSMRPVVAIYSTFLQRAFDQIVHDVCQNDQPVLIAVDRAGLVGEDGTSHQGMFTLPAQRQIPNLVIASPKDEQELRALVRTALESEHPFALHYPRDRGFGVPEREPVPIPVGRAELVRPGSDVLIVGFGPILQRGLAAAVALEAEGWSVAVLNARFAKPLDRDLILDQSRGKRLVVTLEESVVVGGFGSAVLELLGEARLAEAELARVPVRVVGIPAERFVEHGSVTDLRRVLRLDAAGITGQIRETLDELGERPPRVGHDAETPATTDA